MAFTRSTNTKLPAPTEVPPSALGPPPQVPGAPPPQPTPPTPPRTEVPPTPPPAPAPGGTQDTTTTHDTVDANGNTITLRVVKHADGSADIYNEDGSLAQHIDPSGQVTAGAPPPTGTGGTGGAAGTGAGTSGGTGGIFWVPPNPLAGQPSGRWQTTDGQQFATQADAQRHQDALNAASGGGGGPGSLKLTAGSSTDANIGSLGTSQGLTTASALNKDYARGAIIDAATNNEALLNRNALQTTQDIARTAEAGGQGQAAIRTAADQVQGTGNTIYADANAAAAAARALGAAGLATAQDQGAAAQDSARVAAAPLTGLGTLDEAAGAQARQQAQDYAARTGVSLDQATQIVNRLLGINTTAPGTAALGGFTGSAGTAGELDAFRPTTATNVGGFQGSVGNAPALEGVQTGVSATGNLLGFTGTPGTANDLRNMPTGVSATGDLAHFEGEGGVGLDQLERLARGEDIGPSAAEALLRKQSDQTMAQNIALARSGRGAGENASAMRSALFTNAGQQQQLGNDMAALRATEAATARGQNIGAATAAAGTSTTVSGQKLGALTAQQTGELQAEQDRLNALVASGQMTQTQAAQQLDSFKSAQQGQLASVAQRSENLATAGAQRQTQSAQQLDAMKTQQATELQEQKLHLDAMVASGQMTQEQANQRLDAMKAAQQGQLASIAQASTNATAAAATSVDVAKVNQALSQTFGTLGLQYDVNSGQVFNAAGQIVQGGDKIAAELLSTGLSNQVGQGQVAAGITAQGMSNLASLTNSSAGMKQAAAVLGFQTAATITGLSQAQLAQLDNIVSRQNKEELETWAAYNGLALSTDAMGEQQTGAIFAAVGTIVGGAAGLVAGGPAGAVAGATVGGAAGSAVGSDIRSKTDIKDAPFNEWLKNNSGPESAMAGAPTGASAKFAQDQLDKLHVAPPLPGGDDGYSAFGPAPVDTGFKPLAAMAPAAAPLDAAAADKQRMQWAGLGAQMGGALGGLFGRAVKSDEKSKKNKDDMSFDEWLASKRGDVDVREAKGYSYKYKDPSAPGAAPGEQYGPMAQALEKTSAADAVGTSPNGMKFVDPGRAALASIAGLSEQQRRLDAHEAVLKRLIGRAS